MARKPRLVVAGQPHHLIQRGHNRQPIFLDDQDRQQYLQVLSDCARAYGVAIHAYVLMDTHVHVLATPAETTSLSACWRALGRRYVVAFNQRHQRSGTLWEGRFKTHLVDPDAEFMACMRYIELNPQRTGQVQGLTDHPWSSLRHHLGLLRDPLITDHAAFWQTGNTPFERDLHYLRWLEEGVSQAEAKRISEALNKGHVLGAPAYLARMEQATARSLQPLRRGRPKKQTSTASPK